MFIRLFPLLSQGPYRSGVSGWVEFFPRVQQGVQLRVAWFVGRWRCLAFFARRFRRIRAEVRSELLLLQHSSCVIRYGTWHMKYTSLRLPNTLTHNTRTSINSWCVLSCYYRGNLLLWDMANHGHFALIRGQQTGLVCECILATLIVSLKY